MIPVNSEFSDAQSSDSAALAFQIQLVLPDYAASANGATITSSGDDASGNYPKEGAINSDHTEINIGAASAADNGIGKASWKASANANGTGNNWLVVTFAAAKTFNRVKLYNRSADPLTSYILQYWDGAAWVTFAGTPDLVTPPSSTGYGQGGYGSGGYGGTGGGSGGYTGQLDLYSIATDITSTKIKLIVYSTTSGGPAQVVELEVYRLVDISKYVVGFRGPDRKKDFKLQQPIACQEVLTVDNDTRFFSISYTPTAAQIAAGYVNAELGALGLGLEVNEGYYTTKGIELIRTFTGSVDSIAPTVGTDTAEIVARDGIKFLLNQQDSCKLKTATPIEGCLQYVLNRNGVSNYEMTLATTGITIPIFFYYDTNLLTEVQSLVQAAGDALFFFDEFGNATLQYYLTATPQQGSYSGATAWATGTLTNIDNTQSDGAIRREWFLIDDFADGEYTTNPTWTRDISGVMGVVSNQIEFIVSNFDNATSGHTTLTPGFGVWQFKATATLTAGNQFVHARVYPISSFNPATAVESGYALVFYVDQGAYNNHIMLCRFDADDSMTIIIDCGAILDGSQHTWRITRASPTGLFTVYRDGSVVGTPAADTTFLTSVGFAGYLFTPSFGSGSSGTLAIGDIYYSPSLTNPVDTATNVQSVWISPTIDRGTALSANGIFNSTYTAPSGCSVTYYTAASADGITWDAYTVATPGVVDPCALKRYERVKVVLGAPEDDGNHNANLATPIVYNLTVAWCTGTGQQKWSPTVNFYITDENGICDLQQQVSDNLSGDTSIVNDVAVSAAPLVLAGTSTDTQWQATAGTISAGTYSAGPPPSYVGTYVAAATANKVDAGHPLVVAIGTVSFICVVSGGMDTSGMAGGSCIAITWGTATGTAAITYVHPTTPVLTLTVTGAGTITDLRLIGYAYSNLQTPYLSTASDAKSITLYKRRHQDVENDFLQNGVMTGIVAARIISNQGAPVSYIPSMPIFPPLINMQPGDRCNITNAQTGIAEDYYVVGLSRGIDLSTDSASVDMAVILIKIPTA